MLQTILWSDIEALTKKRNFLYHLFDILTNVCVNSPNMKTLPKHCKETRGHGSDIHKTLSIITITIDVCIHMPIKHKWPHGKTID